MQRDSRIFVAGHRGLVGSAIVRQLRSRGFDQLLLRTRQELELRDQAAVKKFFAAEKPEFVFLSAAKAGGIWANDKFRGDFILENLQIETNVIGTAFETGTEKLLFLGTSCIYPKFAVQPIAEESLLSGPLEPTNDAYAVAKIAGLILCRSLHQQYGRRFVSIMPTNVYGPGDNYNLETAHVLPALIRRFQEAKASAASFVTLWGSGTPLREFIYSEDLADAALFCMEKFEDAQWLNVGSGQEISVRDLANLVREIVGFGGEIRWDSTKPDGTPRKLLDSGKLFGLGWKPQTELRRGIEQAYRDFTARPART